MFWCNECWQFDLWFLPFLNQLVHLSGSSQVHILLKPNLKHFELYHANIWNKLNCTVVWTFFGIPLLWHCNEKWPFPVLNQSIIPCPVLRRQERSGTLISFRIFQSLLWSHTVKGFSIVSEAQVDVFLEFPCFSHDPMNADNVIHCSPAAISKSSCIFGSSQLTYCWSLAGRILSTPLLICEMSAVVQ